MIGSRSSRSRSMTTKSAGAPGTSAPVPGAPVALRPLAIGEPEELRRRPGALEAETAVQHLHQPHLAQRVVVLVERQPIDADRDRAAASVRGGDRCEAGAQMQVGGEIGDDARAGCGDHVESRRAGRGCSAPVSAAPTGSRCRGGSGRCRPGNARPPRRAGRWSPADACGCAGRSAPSFRQSPPAAALNTTARRPGRTARRPSGRRSRPRSHPSARYRLWATSARGRTIPRSSLRSSLRESDRTGSLIAIDDRVLVADRERKGDADADIGRRARDRLGFVDERHGAARPGVMDHHRRAAGARRTRQRGGAVR